MDGQTDVGHINLIGGLVTRNPPKNQDLISRIKFIKKIEASSFNFKVTLF